MCNDLKTLGDELRLVDQGVLELIQKRMRLARKVGFFKYLRGDMISRPSVEDARIAHIRQYAETIDLNPNFAAMLLYALIDESCKEQMIQLQRGKLLQENMMQLDEYGNETRIQTSSGTYKGFNLRPRALSSQDRDFVFKLIYPVAQSAFGQPHSEMFANDVRAHALDHEELLIVQDMEGNIVAFRVWDVFVEYHKPVIYLAGMCVAIEHQKGGLGSAMILKALELCEQSHPNWGYAVLRTQNWAMQKSMASIASKSGVYQKFGDTTFCPEIQSAAKIVAERTQDKYFNPVEMASRRIYGASLYGASRNFQDGFSGLNVAEGDAAYCVWRR